MSPGPVALRCILCGSERGTQRHTIYYVRESELAPNPGLTPMHQTEVDFCLGCKASRTAHFMRLRKKAALVTAVVTAALSIVGVTLAVWLLDPTNPGFGEALLGGVFLAFFAAPLFGIAVFAGFTLRAAPHRAAQDLAASNAARLGLDGCFGFWTEQPPLIFHYNGRSYRLTRA